MYSQNNEEQIIANYFKEFIGKFLDIGAYDGKNLSNTYRLAEQGWSGICVEPSVSAFSELLKNHNKNKGVLLINAAVAPTSCMQLFYDSMGDAVSTTNKVHKTKWENGSNVRFRPYYINTITIKQIMNIQNEFDFVNIDVEGNNFALFETWPFDICRPKCFCIEHDGTQELLNKIFSYHKYRLIEENAENLIYVL